MTRAHIALALLAAGLLGQHATAGPDAGGDHHDQAEEEAAHLPGAGMETAAIRAAEEAYRRRWEVATPPPPGVLQPNPVVIAAPDAGAPPAEPSPTATLTAEQTQALTGAAVGLIEAAAARVKRGDGTDAAGAVLWASLGAGAVGGSLLVASELKLDRQETLGVGVLSLALVTVLASWLTEPGGGPAPRPLPQGGPAHGRD